MSEDSYFHSYLHTLLLYVINMSDNTGTKMWLT